MPYFVILVNGKEKSLVRLPKKGVRGINITWLGAWGDSQKDVLLFDIGGTEKRHRQKAPRIRIGDEVIIKISKTKPTMA